MKTISLNSRSFRALLILLTLFSNACSKDETGLVLPPCTSQSPFKILPVDLTKVSYLGPIGTLAPTGGSPLPKEHTGFMLNQFSVPLIAPGDLTITEVRKVTYLSSPTRPGYVDYAIFFGVCNEVAGHFGHVTSLNPDLQPSSSQYQCTTYSTVDETVEACTAYTEISVASGTQLATCGSAAHSPAIDIHMTDSRVSDGYINPSRYGKSGVAGVLCPWDFFEDSIKTQLYAKIGLNSVTLTTENPKCGSVAVDRAGTAAGRWTPASNPGNAADPADGKFLVLAPDVYKPETRIAYSTRITGITPSSGNEGMVYPRFTVQSTGRINITPSAITANGQIYCYDTDLTTSTESFLVQLDSDSQLKVEKTTHSAGGSVCNADPSTWAFSSNAVSLMR